MLGLIFHQLSMAHSSEINGLRSTKCCSETLQNFLYFMHKKTWAVFSFLISCNFIFSLMNEKVKLHKMKNEKTTWVFLYTKHSKFWSVLQQKPLISEGRYKQLLLPCRLSWEYYYVYHDKRRKMTSYVQFLL